MLRHTLPPHVVMICAKGREYFYFQRFRGTRREEARHVLPGCPTNPDGTPNETWWAAYRLHAGEIDRRRSGRKMRRFISANSLGNRPLVQGVPADDVSTWIELHDICACTASRSRCSGIHRRLLHQDAAVAVAKAGMLRWERRS